MKISPITKLKNDLLTDKDYIEYEEIYMKENIIDKGLLIKLLNNHLELYYFFLKINIFTYRYDKNINDLPEELQDFLHHKGKVYYLDDLFNIMVHYSKNYHRCRAAIKMIIDNELRPLNEINLLQEILNRPVDKEIVKVYEDKGSSNE